MFDGYPNGRTFQTYESNIAFVLRFMIDKKMTGSAWLELAANKYEVVPDDQKVSHCQFELHAKYAPFPPRRGCSDARPYSFACAHSGRRTSLVTPLKASGRTSRPSAFSPSVRARPLIIASLVTHSGCSFSLYSRY